MLIGNIAKKAENHLYLVFRVFVGLLFFQHGAQKMLGWFGGEVVEFGTVFWIGGIIEFLVGIAIVIGLLTRLAALFGALEMAGAYFMVHFPQGLVPIANRGELALLYFAAFIAIIIYGAKKWSIDNSVIKKEIF